MIIPYESITSEVLEGIIREFVLREGTEYGRVDHCLESKVEQVRRQLERGDAVIVFDAESESCDIRLAKSRASARSS